MTSRRNSQEPPEKGGWNAHCTYTAGYDLLNPGSNPSLNAVGRAGFVGWPTDPAMAELRSSWFDAADLPSQQRIARDIQARFMESPPYYPLGQFFQAAACRRTVSNIPRGPFSLFWGIEKD